MEKPPSSPEPEGRIFSYREALESFPTVRDLTAEAVARIEAVVGPLKSRDELEEQREETEEAVGMIVAEWAEEVAALGCHVKGLWLVDWDSGDGYYCWRYPEDSIGFYHTYDEGFAGRVPIN